MTRRIGFSVVSAMVAALSVVSGAPVAAQSPTLLPPPVVGPWTGPRTPDGQPNVQGIYRSDTSGLSHSLEEGADPGDDPAGRAAEQPPNVIYDPPTGRMPYRPEALAQKRQNLINLETPSELDHIDPDDRCHLPGVPRSTYVRSTNYLQILQVADHVLLFYPWAHVHRVIPLDGRPRLGPDARLFLGAPRGRWDGNTLVIETTNLDDRTWIDSHGSHHSDALRVVERWTFESANRLSVDVTVEDPKVFTQPWKFRIEHSRNKTEDEDILWEHACFEGERNVPRILSIGRNLKAAGKTGIHTHNLPASIK